MASDIHFYFDPVCPFCWLTSKWVRMVQAQRDLTVDWRFISLRLINEHIDYDAHFPPEYEAGHTAGLRLLRVAARARHEHGAEAVDTLQAALGAHIFDTTPAETGDVEGDRHRHGTREFLAPVLSEVGLPTDLADALDDTSWDDAIRADGDEARAIWDIEHEAQAAAFAAVQPGIPCEAIDTAARAVLEKAGLGPDYRLPGLPHRTGHGIGLSIHEPAYLVRGDRTPLVPGMCFSNEPMIVVPDRFGIRLEDHFHVTDTGAAWFTEPQPSIDRPFG